MVDLTEGAVSEATNLATEITELCSYIYAAEARLLALIREFDEHQYWAEPGLCSCAHWLNFKCGIGLNAAREKVRVAHALADLPKISEAFDKGELSYSKVRAITRIANADNEDYLLMIADLRRIPLSQQRKMVGDAILATALREHVTRRIGDLSKGYRQRVGLAQALIHDPEVLILDEPTSGLDPNQLVDIRALIRRLGQDRTVILSTHIMQEVEAMCDRVVLIRLGEIVADASVDVNRSGAVGIRRAGDRPSSL